MPTIKTFRDFFSRDNDTVEIVCLIRGCVVRRLTLKGEKVSVDPMTDLPVEVPADTEITYEPWMFDRGSMLFPCAWTAPKMAKCCTELDIARYPDGHEESITPEVR